MNRTAPSPSRSSRPASRPRQSIARPSRLELLVRNTGTRTVPNVAVTIDSFAYATNYPELAANKRPIWVVEQGPGKIPQASRGEPGSQPARRRPDRLRQHLGARPARGRTYANIPLAGRARQAGTPHGPLHGRRRPRRQGPRRAGERRAATGHFTVDIAPSPRPPTSIPTPARSSRAPPRSRPSSRLSQPLGPLSKDPPRAFARR